jgi:Glycosyltransferase family 87
VRDISGRLLPWVVAGAIAWAGLAWLGWTLWQSSPPRAGFDLALLLEGARRVVDGQSPYDPSMITGSSLGATDLFYSYPPPVAQALTVLTWLPNGVVLVGWAIAATAGLGLVSSRIAVALGAQGRRTAIRTLALAPLVLPFAVALLFGNLDVWYPLMYGALLLAVLPGATHWARYVGGAAAAIVSVAKLHPAPLLLWIGVRALRGHGGPDGRVLAAAIATGVATIAASLLIGGLQPWFDYIQVLSTAADAELVDPRNLAPVSLIGLASGLDGQAIRAMQAVIVVAIVLVTILAAMRVRDPLTGFALVTAASLATLPVTWYHYPAAMLPVAIALAIRYPQSRVWLALVVVVVDVAIAYPPVVWLAVAMVVLIAAGSTRSGTIIAASAAAP